MSEQSRSSTEALENVPRRHGETTQAESKLTFAELGAMMDSIMTTIDDLDTIVPEHIQTYFSDLQERIEQKVDRTIRYLDYVETMRNETIVERDALNYQIKKSIAYEAKFREYLYQVVKSTPGVVYKGRLGKFTVAKNTQPKVVYSKELQQRKRSLDHVVTKEEIAKHRLEPYVDQVAFDVVNTTKLKQALVAGETFPWCEIALGEHLNVTKTRSL